MSMQYKIQKKNPSSLLKAINTLPIQEKISNQSYASFMWIELRWFSTFRITGQEQI